MRGKTAASIRPMKSPGLMQQRAPAWSEFCVAGNHDPVNGNNPMCLITRPIRMCAPCAANCAGWDIVTHRTRTRSRTASITSRAGKR